MAQKILDAMLQRCCAEGHPAQAPRIVQIDHAVAISVECDVTAIL